jgi:cytochrome c oxidase subunit 2
VWSIIPAAILVLIALVQRNSWNEIKVDAPRSEEAYRVEVFAKQFEWRFCYAGKDGQFGTPDDIYWTNQLHVPKGKKVLLEGRSQDVLHSLFLPHMRVKQDFVPGMNVHLWFEATQAGAPDPNGVPKPLDIACAELCGLGHYRMAAKLYVHEDESTITPILDKQLATYGPWDSSNPSSQAYAWAWKWGEQPAMTRTAGK